MKFRVVVGLGSSLVVLFFLGACQGGGNASFDGERGTVSVFLTDAPIGFENVQSVMVTLTGVVVYPEEVSSGTEAMNGSDPEDGGSPIVLTTHPATFDLLTLTEGATALLATEEVPAGDYSRIRLQVSDATLVFLDQTSVPLKIDAQKVDVPIHFRVQKNAETEVTLDFNAAASVQVNQNGSGTYLLRPVVTGSTGTP